LVLNPTYRLHGFIQTASAILYQAGNGTDQPDRSVLYRYLGQDIPGSTPVRSSVLGPALTRGKFYREEIPLPA
jgi:hypothetical protein